MPAVLSAAGLQADEAGARPKAGEVLAGNLLLLISCYEFFFTPYVPTPSDQMYGDPGSSLSAGKQVRATRVRAHARVCVSV